MVELKFGGKDIPVTSANRIAYIHLVADYRLNKQIRPHCLAFRQGLANVVSLEWLRMFDQQEIQVPDISLCVFDHRRGKHFVTVHLRFYSLNFFFFPGVNFWCTSSHKSGGPKVFHQLLRYVIIT